MKIWDRKWIFFLIQQAVLLAITWAFLNLVRRFSGRSIHSGRQPLGPVNVLLVLILWIVVSVATYLFYRATEGTGSPSFGVLLSARRVADFVVGSLAGLVVVGLPTLLGLILGTMSIADTMRAHYSPFSSLGYFMLGIFLLLGNSVSEEITSRAYPIQLFREKPLWVKIVVPSIIFAALHLADERFNLAAFYERTIAGIVLSIAYALTENIWLASGLHTGMNAASVWTSGKWWVGAIVTISGRPLIPEWTSDVLWTVVSIVGFVWLAGWRRAPKLVRAVSASTTLPPSG